MSTEKNPAAAELHPKPNGHKALRHDGAAKACALDASALRWIAGPLRVPGPEECRQAGTCGILGQERALAAVEFGLSMKGEGFHLYVAGPPGIGKMTAVRALLEKAAPGHAVPPDLCYVHNFEDPYRPRALRLAPGLGSALRRDMDRLVERLREELPRVFGGPDYTRRREEIVETSEREHAGTLEKLASRAESQGFALEVSPLGFLLSPVKGREPMPAKEFEVLPPEEKARIKERRTALEKEMRDTLQVLRESKAAVRERLAELDRRVALTALEGLFHELRERYQEQAPLLRHLDAVQEDLLRHVALLKKATSPDEDAGEKGEGAAPRADALFWRYRVNVAVDNSSARGAPVVVELNPWHGELFGRIEKEGRLGTLTTDYSLVKAGSLLRANGGFLVIPAEALLTSPFSWESLKRALRGGELRVEDPEERYGLFATKSLRPEAVPLQVKVVLVGPERLYYLLQAYDSDFRELFGVRADFDTRMPRDDKGAAQILSFLALLCEKEGLAAFDGEAAGLVVEHAARLAESQSHLSTHFGALAEVAREAAHWAARGGAARTQGPHVRKALEAKAYRSGLIEAQVRDMIRRGTLLLSTSGSAVGQANGLAVVDLGDYAFGKPSRITASVGPGRDGIVDIEREVELSGPIHSKGVLILNGLLVHRYGQSRPLSLTARLVFEQSYSGVEGDSASSAELYALLSALSGLPLRQGVAVSGSVNQHGEIQAVGGVNEKIEGFYDVCRLQGLTGSQGVVIPRANAGDLMLREDVVSAVRSGRFHVWAVGTVDEGVELLAGLPAGRRGRSGGFPEGTVNALVEAKLSQFARSLRQDGAETQDK